MAQMCCIDLAPFNIVERSGFRDLIHYFDPSVEFPTSRTVATSALDDVYKAYLLKVKSFLEKSPQHLTLVLDMWTDRFRKLCYINIRVHFCQEFELKVVSLTTEYFPKPHNNKAITEKILKSLKEFCLDKKSFTAVTDGGSNIVASLRKQRILRYHCLAHSIHLFLTHDILEDQSFEILKQILTKLKKIFKALRYKGEDLQELHNIKNKEKVCSLLNNISEIWNTIELDNNFHIGELEELEEATICPRIQSLKNSVQTRWNSLLRMIRSFCDNVDEINLLLLKIDMEHLLIPEMENKMIFEFSKFLEIFEDATVYLQGQQYPTMSSCIYFFESIYSKISTQEIESEFEITINLYNFSKESFYKRFKIMKIHVVAALLDPCQKNWDILTKYIRKIPSNAEDNFVLAEDVEGHMSKHQLLYSQIEKLGLKRTCTDNINMEPRAKKEVCILCVVDIVYLC